MRVFKFGIVGFGVVGKSVLQFATHQIELLRKFFGLAKDCQVHIVIWDKRELSDQETDLIAAAGANYSSSEGCSLDEFLGGVDKVLVSPGVAMDKYERFSEKFVAELDLFAALFHKPSVAITGSLGKTTVTRLAGLALDRALQSDMLQDNPLLLQPSGCVLVGGNIGRGMIELVSEQADTRLVVLELSSFQLEGNKTFSPSVAVWTNLYPNHLDRHGDMTGYFNAKLQLLRAQRENDVMVIGAQLLQDVQCRSLFLAALSGLKAHLVIVADHRLAVEHLRGLARPCEVLLLDNAAVKVMRYNEAGQEVGLEVYGERVNFPPFTFTINWLTVLAVLKTVGVSLRAVLADLAAHPACYVPGDQQHRVEYVGSFGGVAFYNDSKSTVVEATLAAVSQLGEQERPIHLILGGLGKNVDRSGFAPAVASLPWVKRVYAFGKEASQLGLDAASTYPDLQSIMKAVMQNVLPGDIVLLSPGGTSYDLFNHYEHRGQVFKELVRSAVQDLA